MGSDVREAVDQRGHHRGLGVAYLDASAAVRPQLGGGIADGGEGAPHEEFPLSQAESASGVEVTKAEFGQKPG